jgi:RNA polymerase sigma-70 factor (ECF subfamily)
VHEDESSLLNGLRAREPEAYESLVRRYGGRMFRVAHRLLRHEQDAADAVQDAFIAAFRNLDGFAGNARLATWLHRIVVNTSLAKLRRALRRRPVSIDTLLPRSAESIDQVAPVAGWSDRSYSRLESDETRALVRSCIDRLPHDYREVLILRDIEEFDTDQTAGLLGISPANVKTRLHRARQALRTLLMPALGKSA